jgi:hypothetical protein
MIACGIGISTLMLLFVFSGQKSTYRQTKSNLIYFEDIRSILQLALPSCNYRRQKVTYFWL